MPNPKGWRTFIVAAATVFVGSAAALDDPSSWTAWGLIVTGALMAGLRAITSTPPTVGR